MRRSARATLVSSGAHLSLVRALPRLSNRPSTVIFHPCGAAFFPCRNASTGHFQTSVVRRKLDAAKRRCPPPSTEGRLLSHDDAARHTARETEGGSRDVRGACATEDPRRRTRGVQAAGSRNDAADEREGHEDPPL